MASYDPSVYEPNDTIEAQCTAFEDEFINFSAGSNSELAPGKSHQQIIPEYCLDPSAANIREPSFEATPATTLIEGPPSSVMNSDAGNSMALRSGFTTHAMANATATNLDFVGAAAICSSVEPMSSHSETPTIRTNSAYVPCTYEESLNKRYFSNIGGSSSYNGHHNVIQGVEYDAQSSVFLDPIIDQTDQGGPLTVQCDNGHNIQSVETPSSTKGSSTMDRPNQTRTPSTHYPSMIANRDTTDSCPPQYPGGIFWDQPYKHPEVKIDGRKNNELHKLKRAKAGA